MQEEVYDYLIVGQGIAGSVMAMTLLQQDKTVYLVDSPKPNTSSRIAAGIMNPITGKRMTLTWKANTFLPSAINFYKQMETLSGKSFLYEKPIVRVFSSVGEQNDWAGKLSNPKYSGFVTSSALDTGKYEGVDSPHGSLLVTGGGRLDTSGFLDFVRGHFDSLNQFRESEIEMNDVKWVNGTAQWENIVAKQVIYCTGVNVQEWDYLPFTPMKGEVLEVSINNIDRENVYVGGCFLCPTTGNKLYAGATYDWRNTDLEKTDKAKTDILDKISKFTLDTIRVCDHRVGIRPAVKDRRPLIGGHQTKQNQFLFSGLGSKGVSMAPSLAVQLIEHIERGAPLDPEVDLKRFNS